MFNNCVVLIGHLANDMKVGKIKNGDYAQMTVIVDNNLFRDHHNFSYINVAMFRTSKFINSINKLIHKGDKVGITGRLQSDRYKKNGSVVYSTEVIANSIHKIFN